jgi:hypothetical protein
LSHDAILELARRLRERVFFAMMTAPSYVAVAAIEPSQDSDRLAFRLRRSPYGAWTLILADRRHYGRKPEEPIKRFSLDEELFALGKGTGSVPTQEWLVDSIKYLRQEAWRQWGPEVSGMLTMYS